MVARGDMDNGAGRIYTEIYLGLLSGRACPRRGLDCITLAKEVGACLSHCFCFLRITGSEFWSNRARHPARLCFS